MLKISMIIKKISWINKIINLTYQMCGNIEKKVCFLEEKVSLLEEENRNLQNEMLKLEKKSMEANKMISFGFSNYFNYEYGFLTGNSKTKVLLVGFYGARNLGDELMLNKIYNDLKVDKDKVWVMLCDNEKLDLFHYENMNIIHYPKTRFDYIFLANQFECLVFGGGAIIDDTLYDREGSYTFDLGKIFIELANCFINKGKKVYSIALSSNKKLVSKLYSERLTKIIQGSCYFSVRDSYSQKVIEDATGEQVCCINDIVLTYDKPKIVKEKREKTVISIVWICNNELLRKCIDMIEGLIDIYQGEKIKIKLIPFYDYQDTDYCFYLKLKDKINRDVEMNIVEMPKDFESVWNELYNSDVIVSMRYHGALIGLMTGNPTFYLLFDGCEHYYNKMNDIYEKFNQKRHLFTNLEEMINYIEKATVMFQPQRMEYNNSDYYKIVEKIGV